MATSEENLARIEQIKKEIAALTSEAMGLAETEKVALYFGDLSFANAYGAGGLTYTPEGAKDRWGGEPDYDDVGLWRSSGSDYC